MLVKVLDSQLANMIAAGEVVERPSSVAKELCENSVDAGASAITVEIWGGGIKSLSVTDNGHGLHPEDMETAFLRHATSKISKPDDLNAILTLGFRGEALASIGAVSKVTMTSCFQGEEGKKVVVEGGKFLFSGSAGCPNGTRIMVENLFYNTPARMKFLKKDYTEAGYVEETVRTLALAHPEISFRFVSDGKEKLFTSGDGNLKNTVYSIYGKEVSSALVPLEYEDNGIKISGLAGNITLYRKNRKLQSFFVNNRGIVNRTVTAALEEGFKGMIPIGCFPVAFIKININPALVDVNVHPAKLEVKFADENSIYSAIYWAVKGALENKLTPVIDAVADVPAPEPEKPGVKTSVNVAVTSYETAKETESEKNNTAFEYKPTVTDLEEFLKQQKDESVSLFETIEKEPAPMKKIEQIEFTQTTITPTDGEYKIIGQLFDTYILVQEGDNLTLIDQHAAHERLIYERLVKEKKEKEIAHQMLLVPEVVSLTPVEFSVAMENTEFFNGLGWEIEEFGNNDIVVRAIPYVITKEQIKDTLVEIISNLQLGRSETGTAKEDRILYTIACRSAVKGNDKLTLPEMEKLVREVKNSEKTLTCPHGRPVSTVITKTFIEKLFKRL